MACDARKIVRIVRKMGEKSGRKIEKDEREIRTVPGEKKKIRKNRESMDIKGCTT